MSQQEMSDPNPDVGAGQTDAVERAEPGAHAGSYESAAARVEEIIRRLDSGEASLNETLELVQEGKALIELCARELEAVAGALQELRLDELVARLERERTPEFAAASASQTGAPASQTGAPGPQEGGPAAQAGARERSEDRRTGPLEEADR
jgi:exodeoxyribonuclease VII small subunit